MIVRFFDRQDKSNPLNGTIVSGTSELLSALEEMRRREPFFFELVGDNGYNLLVGLAKELGSVQFSRGDGYAPYFMAVGTGEHDDDSYVEFLTADTPTPVPRRYCMDLNLLREIVAFFLETGERSPSVKWEEV